MNRSHPAAARSPIDALSPPPADAVESGTKAAGRATARRESPLAAYDDAIARELDGQEVTAEEWTEIAAGLDGEARGHEAWGMHIGAALTGGTVAKLVDRAVDCRQRAAKAETLARTWAGRR